jgi:hypothetical protein
MIEHRSHTYGVLGEFDTEHQLCNAARAARAAGWVGLGGFFFQYWVNLYAYPMNIAGRPLNSWPAFIPVTFELTVLGASLSAVFGMLALNKLPEPHHPLFNIDRFVKHATTDKFFLCIEARDKKFNVDDAKRFFEGVHATKIDEVQDDD